jgi:predicted 3-demethylubiquinone-9 3-methyltransferase (glyoxalase superfamily)
MQKITPFLWFDNQAEEAANFYASVFSAAGGSASGGKNSMVGSVARYDEAGSKATGMPKGSAMTVSFTLEGLEFTAINAGQRFKFTEAISFVIDCKTQEEVDYFWEKLTAGGGQESMCGWLKDKFGLSWQVVPTVLIEMLQDKDAAKSQRVMQAMLQMKKIDIKKLKQSYERQ